MSVLIVGSVALDSIQTPAGRLEAAQGGSASYASLSASFWTEPSIIAVIGDDYPQPYLDLLRSHGVRLDPGLEVVKGGKSFHWSGLYKGTMNEAITRQTELGVFATFNPVVPDSLRHSRFMLLGNIDPELQMRVLQQVDRPDLIVVDTMNLWIDIKRPELLKVLGKADVIVLNDGEARLLGEDINLHRCARYLREEVGARYVIIKKGEHGATFYGDGHYFSLPAYPVSELKDPTGAGDSFAGGFVGYLARLGRTDVAAMRQAMVVGTVMASCCVEHFSLDYANHLTQDELTHRLKRLREYTAFDEIAEVPQAPAKPSGPKG